MITIRATTDVERIGDPRVRAFAACRLRQLNKPPPEPGAFPEARSTLYLVEDGDDVAGEAFGFVGSRGLLSDLWEEHDVGDPEFARPFEWVSHQADLGLYEVLLLFSDEEGAIILVPDSVVSASPELAWVLTSEEAGGLDDPVPCG